MRLVVGRVGKAHGIRGEVFVEPFTDAPEIRFADGQQFNLSNGDTLTIEFTKWHSGKLLVHFGGIDNRNDAELLRGIDLVADVDPHEQPDDPDEFYDHQLIGLKALVGDSEVGEIIDVLHLPGQDVLVLKKSDDIEVLIPFVSEIVPEVNIKAATIVLTPPPGLLNDEEAVVVMNSDDVLDDKPTAQRITDAVE